MKTLFLTVDLFRLSCAYVPEGAAAEALNRAAKVFSPCGIELKAGKDEVLQAKPAWCFLPDKENDRRPLIHEIANPRRKRNPKALSLFLIPSDPLKPQWSAIRSILSSGSLTKTPTDATHGPTELTIRLTVAGSTRRGLLAKINPSASAPS